MARSLLICCRGIPAPLLGEARGGAVAGEVERPCQQLGWASLGAQRASSWTLGSARLIGSLRGSQQVTGAPAAAAPAPLQPLAPSQHQFNEQLLASAHQSAASAIPAALRPGTSWSLPNRAPPPLPHRSVPAPQLAAMSVFPLLYLLSGVVLNTVSQHITDLRFSAPEAHIIPAVKFSATLVGAALRRPARSTATREQAWLMAAIGLLDASAYTVYCLGFFRLVRTCGALSSTLVAAALFSIFWPRSVQHLAARCSAPVLQAMKQRR